MDMRREINRIDNMSLALANQHQVDDSVVMALIKLTNATGTYLDHLNEHCLLEIFSSSSLSPMDLCSLAETCALFKRVAQLAFPKEFGIDCSLKSGYKFDSKYSHLNCTLKEVERLLKNFGSHLVVLKIDRDLHVVNLVAKYCDGVTLRYLKISGLTSLVGVTVQLNSILERLLEFCICDCNFLATSSYMKCDSLIELKIIDSRGCAAILKNTFPKLERLTWKGLRFYRTTPNEESETLVEFIRRHQHVKAVNLGDGSACSSETFHAINSSCNELDELSLVFAPLKTLLTVGISSLGFLAKLKTLHVDLEFRIVDDRFNALLLAAKSLETMKISQLGPAEDKFFDSLSQLQNLRELHLIHMQISSSVEELPWTMLVHLKKVFICGAFYGFSGRDLPQIIRQIPNLEELQYDCKKILRRSYLISFCLSQDIILEIIEIVKRRDHVLTLRCYHTFNDNEICDVSGKVKLRNLYDFSGEYCDCNDDVLPSDDEYFTSDDDDSNSDDD